MNIAPEMYDAINALFMEVYFKAKRYGMRLDNIEIHATPRIMDSMEINNGDFVEVGYPGILDYKLKAVVDKSIPEFKQKDGTYQSDIKIYSPDWGKE